MKLVHLVGFITKKIVTMHGHVNVKKDISYNKTVHVVEIYNNYAVTVINTKSICILLAQHVSTPQQVIIKNYKLYKI